MSGAERVNSFNPLLILIWVFQLIILGIDWQDGSVTWSIPIIGSFLLIQIYMVWKTNYDEMQQAQSDAHARSLGGPMDTPMIDPNRTDLKDVYSNSKGGSKPSGQMINLNVSKKTKREEE